METHNIDSTIKQVIDESANYYDLEANKAKERIWKQVQQQKQYRPNLFFVRSLVAACILLFISTTAISIAYFNAKKDSRTLAESNITQSVISTSNHPTNLSEKEAVIATNVRSPDTVYIEKNRIVYKPLITTKQVVDTVYVKQFVYIEKEKEPELITTTKRSTVSDSSNQEIVHNHKTEILISNTNSTKKEKNKKIQIKFGGNKDQVNNGALAFTTKL